MMKVSQFLGESKPFSAVTDWIDRLCGPKYEEEELEGIPELVQAINLQQTGPTEASRAIRKKLKYGNLHAQKRALTILRSLVENCNERFHRTFADAMLIERIKIMSQDELVDASVRRKLMRLLHGWHKQFQGVASMHTVAGLYVACGGGRKSEQQLKSEAADAYRKKREREERERQIRSDYKAAKRLHEEEQKRIKQGGKKGQRPPFNFQQEKPQILAAVASTQQYATALVNALQHVNREKDSVTANARVQDYLAKVKAERKKVVRYIQLVKDEEFLGSLISANDQIILALELYDKLAKPSDVDSDENEPLAAISSGNSSTSGGGGNAAERQARLDAEIEAVRKRLLQARLMDAPDGELEKLQNQQRGRIERHNSYARSIASSRNGVTGGGAGSSAMTDLMDLNFDDGSCDNLPPSIQPNVRSSVASSSAVGSSLATGVASGHGGGLSDYSDLDSEEGEESSDGAEVAMASASGSGSRFGATIGANKKSPATAAAAAESTSSLGAGDRHGRGGYEDGDDGFDDAASFASHRPQIGPKFSAVTHLEDDDDGFDPFADPAEDDATGAQDEPMDAFRRRHDGPREAYAAV
ncbi:hypothetical protein K437DRAFT_257064 [Tilletiaria anomala UBC 951]|uniref:VHS domain-containing protein n=1 Tax=Tilletiaria anomala (strain ATCC 24038 / CBS 436.72 / UBC 951) TaxID=1037660 RepID=A0A066VZZ5_TILAU|nr:uncharacterized protein K437DRAFT_257064 [Tilletiaria anomala UBC 951]KDN44359.1 hypothetical protein K437DRAFT_257064 [Tilletiaria anomala UBC 951]